MPPKRVTKLLFNKTEVALIALAFFALGTIVAIGWNIWNHILTPRTITQSVEKKSSFEAKVQFGRQVILATTRESVPDGRGGLVRPTETEPCAEFLVLYFKYPVREDFVTSIQGAEGVVRLKPINKYTIALEKICTDRYDSLWEWSEIWGNILPILQKHYGN